MSQITIQDLSFTYDGDHVPVFEHLDLQLDTRWKLGLVGRNGRGKTTLLHLLDGSLSGSGILNRPGHPIYFPFPVKAPERPAREILLDRIPWEEEWMLSYKLIPEVSNEWKQLQRRMQVRQSLQLHVFYY